MNAAGETTKLKLTDALLDTLSAAGDVVLLDTQDEGRALLFAGTKASLTVKNDLCVIRHPDGSVVHMKENPWGVLKAFRKLFDDEWMAGYLGYDLKNYLEKLGSANPDPAGLPDLWMIVPELVISVRPDGEAEVLRGNPPETNFASAEEFSFNMEADNPEVREKYMKLVAKAKHDIAEGDFYEINLSRQIKGTFSGNPLSLYRAMKKAGPVPFGAWLKAKDFSVCCASPERFLEKEEQKVMSEPIKGTAPVGDSEQENSKIAEELKSSEKNQAENLMIVDLVRHDLNRVCVPGSVQVPELFGIRRYPTVHQMVSRVTGTLRADVDPVESIMACFPMGSMTGAPKISAMEAIDRYESYKRGLYSGAIGYFSPGGDFDFNVVIRTAICKKNKVYYSTGGAITADSDPAEEWMETVLKARALMKCAEGDAAGFEE